LHPYTEMIHVVVWLCNIYASITNFMEQNPASEANSHSYIQAITHTLWDP